jgi:CDP-glucose 4,6-dehydratase
LIRDGFWDKRRVFITGHSGFKGSWLALWLKELGADVAGYALDPPTRPNHFHLLRLDMPSTISDIRDRDALGSALKEHKPEIVFHMAAQALVRYSYGNPLETFEVNVMGTANLFEACRNVPSIRAIVNITSDKCYENRESIWGYRETDPVGGYDPYSASKGAAEIITSSYRNSYFNPDFYGKTHNVLLASVRAGNVVGGGDWAADRLVPDIMRAVSAGGRVSVRNPRATRPWQHVLEPLSGYLLLGRRLLEGRKEFAEAWNFGPDDASAIGVEEVLALLKTEWGDIEYEIEPDGGNLHEASLLRLDCAKARTRLHWKPLWDIRKTLAKTARWYRDFYQEGVVTSILDIEEYMTDGQPLQGQGHLPVRGLEDGYGPGK